MIRFCTRRATLAAAVITATLGLLLLTEFGQGRTRISADELARMRGANRNRITKAGYCNTLTTGTGCAGLTAGADCSTCEKGSYSGIGNAAGAYAAEKGDAQSCGLTYPGVCQRWGRYGQFLRCQLDSDEEPGAACTAPPKAPGGQPVMTDPGNPG